MFSSKVVVGTPTLASEYNILRKDVLAAQYYPVDTVDNDDTFTVENSIIGDYSVVLFRGGQKSTCYFDLMLNDAIASENLLIHIAFDLHSAEVSKNVKLELEYYVIAASGDTTGASTTLTELISTPDTAETLKSLTLTTLKIPLAAMAIGSEISFKLSRLGSDVLDTHGGDLRLFGLQLYQLQT